MNEIGFGCRRRSRDISDAILYSFCINFVWILYKVLQKLLNPYWSLLIPIDVYWALCYEILLEYEYLVSKWLVGRFVGKQIMQNVRNRILSIETKYFRSKFRFWILFYGESGKTRQAGVRRLLLHRGFMTGAKPWTSPPDHQKSETVHW